MRCLCLLTGEFSGITGETGELMVPRAFNSLQACSQALASREEIYTFAPLATNPSEIMRPIPLAPPVTKTTLSYEFVSPHTLVFIMRLGDPTLTLKRLVESILIISYWYRMIAAGKTRTLNC